jgi:hypothetical protein
MRSYYEDGTFWVDLNRKKGGGFICWGPWAQQVVYWIKEKIRGDITFMTVRVVNFCLCWPRGEYVVIYVGVGCANSVRATLTVLMNSFSLKI